MKIYLKIFYFFIVLAIHFSCSRNSVVHDGMYQANNNNLYYAVELNNSDHKIKFYIIENYLEIDQHSQKVFDLQISKQNEAIKDFQYYSEGNFRINHGKLIIEDLESDILPSLRPKQISAETSNGKIIVNCQELSLYLSGRIISCNSDNIEYIRQ